MPLAPLDLLAAIIPAQPADFAGLDRLTVDAARARLRIPSQPLAQPFPQDPMDPLPGPIAPPAAQVPIDALPGRPFLGQKAPGSAGAQLVEEGIEDGAQRVQTGTADGRL